MRVLFLEPFYGGSHKDFADGLCEHSRHEIILATLPARFWKWRMRGAALHFVRSAAERHRADLVLTTDLMSISDLKALWPGRIPPVVLYMHESQLSYPLPDGKRMDLHFGFTDITSCLAADTVVFNSFFHRDSFFSELPPFLGRMPEYSPTWTIDEIRAKSTVIYPGCRFPAVGAPLPSGRSVHGADGPWRNARPAVLWNHRWEYDKQPEVFFEAVRRAKEAGARFDLVILGESFHAQPKCFLRAKEELSESVLQFGYVESRSEYEAWLRRSDIVISTACQENFGISVMEAMRYGCLPLLPNRLSYPELLPPRLHEDVLYGRDDELAERLCSLVSGGHATDEISRRRRDVAAVAAEHAWESRVSQYDRLFEDVAGAHGAAEGGFR